MYAIYNLDVEYILDYLRDTSIDSTLGHRKGPSPEAMEHSNKVVENLLGDLEEFFKKGKIE